MTAIWCNQCVAKETVMKTTLEIEYREAKAKAANERDRRLLPLHLESEGWRWPRMFIPYHQFPVQCSHNHDIIHCYSAGIVIMWVSCFFLSLK